MVRGHGGLANHTVIEQGGRRLRHAYESNTGVPFSPVLEEQETGPLYV